MKVDFEFDILQAGDYSALGLLLPNRYIAVQLLRDSKLDARRRDLLAEEGDLSVDPHRHRVLALLVLLGRIS